MVTLILHPHWQSKVNLKGEISGLHLNHRDILRVYRAGGSGWAKSAGLKLKAIAYDEPESYV